jgi:dynein intermediate chain, cytosolic
LLIGSDRLGLGHHGLVTGLSVHPHMRGKRGHRVALSSGVDWSTKLWSFYLPSTLGDSSPPPPLTAAPLSAKQTSTPKTEDAKMLCDFRGPYEQVSDAEWSPVHPSLFATANGAGQVSLWDITHSLEDPRVPSLTVSNCCLTKLRWSHDGRRIAVGDLDGMVRLMSLSTDLSDPKVEAVSDFDRVIAKLQ